MDDFAQSREPDDLFADELEPVDESQTYESPNIDQVQPTPPTPQKQGIHGGSRGAQHQRVRGGRGRGRGEFASRGGNHSVPQPQQADTVSQPVVATTSEQTTPEPPQNTNTNTTESPAAQATIPAESSRITSVRGDRSATGPAKPTKRTEAELTELMSSMRLKNAAKTQAHERAEADQASYLQREQQAAAKRLEERKAIREQDMERAKNRERKIKAQGVREWDSEKVESDIVDRSRGNSSGYMRGAHGGIAASPRGDGLASSKYGGDYDEAAHRGRGRGRGEHSSRGRGGRAGGGRGPRGRGGFDTTSTRDNTVPTDTDFPALISAKTAPPATKSEWSGEHKSSELPKAGLGTSSWAEEVAAANEELREVS